MERVHEGFTVDALGHPSRAFVERTLAILVFDGDESAVLDQFLSDLFVAPEARVVQGRVAVLVDEVDVGLVLQQLEKLWQMLKKGDIIFDDLERCYFGHAVFD